MINVGTRARQSFSKNSHIDLDLEPRTLKVEHAQYIVIGMIPNIRV